MTARTPATGPTDSAAGGGLAAAAAAAPGWRRGALVLGAAVGLAGGYSAVYFGTLSVFLKAIALSFGWSRASTSGVAVLAQLGVALGAPVVGRLIDRHGARTVIATSIALFALALCALTVLPDSLPLFGATSLLIGFVAVATVPIGYLSVVSRAFDRRLGLALGCAMLGLGCGTVLMPLVAQRWVAAEGWQAAYRSLALLALALGGVALLLMFALGRGTANASIDRRRDAAGAAPGRREAAVPDSAALARHDTEAQAAALTGDGFRAALRSGRFWLVAGVFFGVSTACFGAAVHIVPMLSDRGVSPAEAARGGALIGIGLLVGRFSAGAAMDAVQARFVAAIALLLGAAGLAVLALQAQRADASSAVTAVGAILLGLAIGAEGDFIPFFVRRYFGMRDLGLVFGLMLAIYSLGGVAGPVLYGFAFDRLHDYTVALAAGAVACVCCAVAVLFVGRYRYAAPGTPHD